MSGKRLTDEQRAENLRKSRLQIAADNKGLNPHARIVGVTPEAHEEMASASADNRLRSNLGSGSRWIRSRKPQA